MFFPFFVYFPHVFLSKADYSPGGKNSLNVS
jgi:hypothetical protein